MFPEISSSLIWREQIPGKPVVSFAERKQEKGKGKETKKRII